MGLWFADRAWEVPGGKCLANSFPGAAQSLRERLKNGRQHSWAASARRQWGHDRAPNVTGPGGSGMDSVTRAPPEGWAEAPGEEPQIPPPGAAAAGCFSYSWASCRCACSEARWARAPVGKRKAGTKVVREEKPRAHAGPGHPARPPRAFHLASGRV